MPFTLFHYPVGYWSSKLDKRLVLPGLLMGSVIPDVEVVPLYLFFRGVITDHFILHSFVGALTLGLVLAVLVTRYIYPTLIGRIFNLDREELQDVCGITPHLVLSCAIGIVFHLLLDFPIHWYNHLLWPWVDPYLLVGPLAIFFATLLSADILVGYSVAGAFVSVIMALVLVQIVYSNKENRWRKLWIGH
ncbi:MAG: DUF4184 family protein [Candidatus Thorarchaeota archaeon]|nr:DUF4184 family protein [Candidatus Thorarchaeota archaeon]